ncbi:purine and uridine phosphorylase [Aspergillus steynii IBT 23096]|uniref:Purine and uridine phosphorylase n=1 Tax=Aspergillus steynii IBT 23096 TaxID=1392250 RepID=A0A2I2GKK7_9EURO|nr:purine and uridine phosphorylase [Aspergillus steynii IBT 23096]PLB53416.1 purine and uridine phosphorylase [Aspergillus steynii IBT 23096]
MEAGETFDQYKIGWICALQEEYEAACRMLDEEFDGPELAEDNDINTYAFGCIGQHKVAIVCLPARRYGTCSAARVGRDLFRTFPNLRYTLMVGIGGGAPTMENDVRLGDVVVSSPRDGFESVIHHDAGIMLHGGRFQRTGKLNAPPQQLFRVALEMKRLYDNPLNPDSILEHIGRMDDMPEFGRPELDRLYRADYLHVSSKKTCKLCDPKQAVERPARHTSRITTVHHGAIASGDSVMKCPAIRDEFANDPGLNILCFEMEAAGLMNDLKCLAIRGICDYCDSHKNDDWHNYAALTAAAYARELLLLLKPESV